MNQNLFNSFNQEAKDVLRISQKIAQDSRTTTGTEHLLLAFLITPNIIAGELLRKNMVHLDQINLILKSYRSKEVINKNKITNQLLHILKIAADKVIAQKNAKITSLDLLWAIIQYPDCTANKILEALNIDLIKLKSQIVKNTINNPQKELFNSEIGNLQILGSFDSQNINSNQETNFGSPTEGIFFTPPHFQEHLKTQHGTKTHLNQFGINLTDMAKKNKLDPVIGRDTEIERLIQVLCRRTKNNPVLIGDPGVGKTAIVEGLAQLIANNQIPARLSGKQIFSLDLAATIAGTMYRGQFENRMKQIIYEAKENSDIILFIDEIHTIVGSGSAEGSMDTANILKPALTKGNIRLIGATTCDEYRKFIEKDTALERRLQKIDVSEPTIRETIDILKGIRANYENFHQVKISDEALEVAAKLSMRYINDRFLPDKAIDLIDEAAAATHLKSNFQTQTKMLELLKKLRQIIAKKEQFANKQDYAQAAYLRSRELQLKQEISVFEKKHHHVNESIQITKYDIAKVVSLWTKIPLDNLVKDNLAEIKKLELKLSHFIIGQNQAVKTVASAIRRSKTHLSDPNRPLGTFMFLGPTGVGKTELAKVLARIVFGSQKNLIKIDMSEFMERHNVSRLVGAPPGYVGYEDAGKLTEAVRRQPFSIILMDEIEKAHPEVLNILLQIMEDGYLTDSKGKKVNFKNTIIILTSNIGMSQLSRAASQIGFGNKNSQTQMDYKEIESTVSEEIKQTFSPEFINRLDQIIIFQPLAKKDLEKIVKLQLEKLRQRLGSENIKLHFGPKIIDFIAKTSYEPEFGARPIRRTIIKYIEEPISVTIIKNPNLNEITLTIKNKKIIIKAKQIS